MIQSDDEEMTVKNTAIVTNEMEEEAEGVASAMVVSGASENALDRGKKRFRIPVPGKDGAIPNCLDGLRFVLTGLFPEVDTAMDRSPLLTMEGTMKSQSSG